MGVSEMTGSLSVRERTEFVVLSLSPLTLKVKKLCQDECD